MLKICIAYSVLPVMHFVGGGIRGDFGIFAQMYEKMKRELNVFFLCTVCYYKNGNGTGSDLVLIVGVLLYAVFTDFFKTALFSGSIRNKIFFFSFFQSEPHSPSL